jgi:hypothetical protein
MWPVCSVAIGAGVRAVAVVVVVVVVGVVMGTSAMRL